MSTPTPMAAAGKLEDVDLNFKRPVTPTPLQKLNDEFAERARIELPAIFQNQPASLLTLPLDLTKATEGELAREQGSLGVFDKALRNMEMRGLTHGARYFRFLGIWSVLNARYNGPRNPTREKIVNDIRNVEKLQSGFISQKMDAGSSDSSSVKPSFTPEQKRRFRACIIAYKYLSHNLPVPLRVKDAMRRKPRIGASSFQLQLQQATLTSASACTTSTSVCSPRAFDCDTSHNIDNIEVIDLDNWEPRDQESESEDKVESE